MSALHTCLLNRRSSVTREFDSPRFLHDEMFERLGAGLQSLSGGFDSRSRLPRAQGVCGCMTDCQSDGPGSTPGGRSDALNHRFRAHEV